MPRPTPNTSALSVFGLGTFLLLMWRFIPLPWPVSLALLSAAAGSLAAGVGLVCQDSHHWRRHAALGVALAATGFILFEVAPAVSRIPSNCIWSGHRIQLHAVLVPSLGDCPSDCLRSRV